MTTTHSLYDAPTREVYLLENVSIQGRKTELRQLLKLLNLAKTGQPKAALVTGDAGIGKTALLEAFVQLVREGVYCRILNLGAMDYGSPEVLYVAIIEKLQAEAESILDEALVAVNEITGELDLRWERQDLVRAIALVKLQESIGGKGAVSQEQLVKAIRSQVPAVKKLKFSVNESIEKLVDLIVNPWVMVATSLLNPMSPALQEAIRLADTLKENNYSMPYATAGGSAYRAGQANGHATVMKPTQPVEPTRSISQPTSPSLPFPESETERESGVRPPVDVQTSEISASHTVVHLESSQLGEVPEEGLQALSVPDGTAFSSVVSSTAGSSLPTVRMEASRMDSGAPRPIKDPLIGHLMSVFNFINSAIENIDTALLIVMDEWDRTLTASRQADLKDFLAELVYQVTEQKRYHYMFVTTARTEGESYTLGGPLYNQFRTKLLLDALPEAICRKLVRTQLKDTGVELDDEVYHRLWLLSKGNPFWHLKTLNYVKERVDTNRLRHVDLSFFEKLGIESLHSLPELSFTRLKLTFLNDEESLYKVIATLLKEFGETPFSSNQAIKEISASQGFTDGYVFEVLRALFRHDFIRQIEERPAVPPLGATRLLEDRGGRKSDPHYVIQSRYILEFLQDKTRSIETDISTDEKLMYLKKIIPLSVKSGELDREKTMEVLALSDAMTKPEIIAFLEEIFLEALRDDKPVVRVTALNNVALIDSPQAREALFRAMRDEDSMVREYAARNLSMLSQKSSDQNLANRIVEAMIQAIDDESEAVRAQVYGTLSKYKWHRDMMGIFIKGMSDACDAVRLISVRNLIEMEADSPFVFNALQDAMHDGMVEVRRYACLGLQRFSGAEAIDAMVKALQTDADSGIRALAADSLSRMEDPKAFAALVNALRHEASEDVKLAVVRALGKRRGWQTEEILLESIQNTDVEQAPVLLWAAVRSLGYVGGTERSLNLLSQLKGRLTNPIILSAIDMANRQIYERVDALRQIERQLEEATPLTVAVPSEYDQDVDLPEEDLIPITPQEEPIHSGERELDEETVHLAELAQIELNPSPTGNRPIDLPFEKE